LAKVDEIFLAAVASGIEPECRPNKSGPSNDWPNKHT
jgi:hypothetical protein